MHTESEILPGKRTLYLAYAVESGGKAFLNPASLARRGDEMRVRMVNQLDEPTITHWHGLHNDARNDGNGLVVAELSKAYDYDFKLQDRASMYWCHPHAHGFIQQQAYLGLAFLLFVDDEDERTRCISTAFSSACSSGAAARLRCAPWPARAACCRRTAA